MSDWLNRTHLGDCRDLMRAMAADGVKVQCVVTSPPYYGLRDYGAPGQIGLEPTLAEWVTAIGEVFACVWDVLADDGTLWLNLGDSYSSGGGTGHQGNGQRRHRAHTQRNLLGNKAEASGVKPKNLMGQPWRIAFALQDAGWYLRRDIIWHKPNPMPESAKDRPTTAHEYVFLLSKSERYHYDATAIAEPASLDSHARASRGRLSGYEPPGQTAHHGIAAPRPGVNPKAVAGWATGPRSHAAVDHAAQTAAATKFAPTAKRTRQNDSFSAAVVGLVETRNARSVWTIATEPTSFAHFACFPREIPKRCILAGSRPGDIILDPFMGSGTTGQVATDLGRSFIGCELSAEYLKLHDHRRTTTGMPI